MSQNVMPIRSKSAGFIIKSLNACRMSIFPIFALLPNDEIISTTLSNDEYKTRRKSSCMKSFTLLSLGKNKCDMRRQLLSDFCTSPIGEIRSKGKTPINVVNLEKYLANYPKRIDAELSLNGFSEGFRLQYIYAGPRFSSSSKNLLSAVSLGKNKCDMRRQLLSDFCTSPIGEIRSDDIGFVENGPNIRPKSIALFNLASVSA
jgi:hypothetical protein